MDIGYYNQYQASTTPQEKIMMNKTNEDTAEAYYITMGEKNLEGMEKYLHPHVEFISPFAKHKGKEAVLEAAKKFMSLFQTLTIRAKFGSNEQAVMVYDVGLSSPIRNIPTASLMTFQDGRIEKIELFFDARPF